MMPARIKSKSWFGRLDRKSWKGNVGVTLWWLAAAQLGGHGHDAAIVMWAGDGWVTMR